MSKDRDVPQHSNGGEKKNTPISPRDQIASELLHQLVDDQMILINTAHAKMRTDNNGFLERVLKTFSIQQETIEEGYWTMMGTSFAYLYYSSVAEKIYRTSLPIIGIEDFNKFAKDMYGRNAEEMRAEEFLVGEALKKYQQGKITEGREQMDPTFRSLIGYILHSSEDVLEPEEDSAFLYGAFLVQQLFESFIQQQET